MSLVHLSNVCSHLQNASLARLGLTSIPHSRMHLNLSLQLQKQGFLSNVVLGGPSPPPKLLPPTDQTTELQFGAKRSKDALSLLGSMASQNKSGTAAGSSSSSASESTTSQSDAPPSASDDHPSPAPPPPPKWTPPTPRFPLNELFPASNLQEKTERMLRQEAHIEPDLVTQENRASRRLWLGLKYWDGEPVLRKMKMLSKPTQRLWVTHEDLSKIVRGKRANYVEGLTRVGECLFISTDKGVMEARECMERKIGGLVLCRVWG